MGEQSCWTTATPLLLPRPLEEGSKIGYVLNVLHLTLLEGVLAIRVAPPDPLIPS